MLMQDFNEPTQDPANYKYGIIYFNRNDLRAVVPKMNQVMGLTLNFARIESYLLIGILIAVSAWAFKN